MTEGDTRRLGRRAILTAGAAGVAAAAVQAVVAPAKVLGADHDTVKVGELNAGTLITTVASTGSDGLVGASTVGDGLVGVSTAPGKSGVYGNSTNAGGNGVYGRHVPSNAWGLLGANGLGVKGYAANGEGVRGECDTGDGVVGRSGGSARSGVYGVATHAGGNGVFGRNIVNQNQGSIAGGDHGVWAEGHKAGKAAIQGRHVVADQPGVTGVNAVNNTFGSLGGTFGVEASAPNDLWALGVSGKATFSRSGVLTIPKNAQYAKIAGVALTSASFVIATPIQYRSGIWVAAAVPNVGADSITIYLNKKATAATRVGWIVLERFPTA